MVMGLAACRDTTPSPSGRGLPDVVVITIDTLRADHMGAYGYDRRTTPFIDSLARSGVRFEAAYATSSWTVPAMASITTSRYPSVHRLVHGLVIDNDVKHQKALPETLVTLPGLMQSYGYRTFGIAANRHLDARFGFGRGYLRYACEGFMTADAVERKYNEWLGEIRRSEPYFLWLHLFDPHAPYHARKPYFPRWWGDKPFSEKAEGITAAKQFLEQGIGDDPEEVELLKALYDSEIRYSDEVLRRIVSRIPGADNALIVVTADHGEEFMEHGNFGHGHQLYNETVRVPLIVRLPRKRLAGTVVTDPVSLVDLMPTLSVVIGKAPPVETDGINLLPRMEGRRLDDREIHLSLSRSRELRATVHHRWKFIFDLFTPDRSELFDLTADPRERRSLAAQEPARRNDMKTRIIDHLALSGAPHLPGRAELTDEHIEQLRRLGYVEEAPRTTH